MELTIENMTCGGCAKSVTKAIQTVDANAKVETFPSERRIKVETSATQDAVQDALAAVGYPATAH